MSMLSYIRKGDRDLSVNKKTVSNYSAILGKNVKFSAVAGQYFQVTNPNTLNEDLAVSSWMVCSSVGPNNFIELFGTNNPWLTNGIVFNVRDPNTSIIEALRFTYYNSVYVYQSISKPKFKRWHHYGFSFDRSEELIFFYMNGVALNPSGSAAAGVPATATNYRIGYCYSTGNVNDNYECEIDEHKVYNEVLPPAWFAREYRLNYGRY